MSSAQIDVEQKFRSIFKRVLRIDDCSGTVDKDDIEEWDSLRHVELVFEIEEAFELDIAPDDIVMLYSNTDTILTYLRDKVEGAR